MDFRFLLPSNLTVIAGQPSISLLILAKILRFNWQKFKNESGVLLGAAFDLIIGKSAPLVQ